MSSFLHFYRAHSATTINQLKPLERIRSRSPDDVLQHQQVNDDHQKTVARILSFCDNRKLMFSRLQEPTSYISEDDDSNNRVSASNNSSDATKKKRSKAATM